MVAARRRSTRQQEREEEKEKQASPPPPSPPSDDPEEDPDVESEDSEPPIVEQPKKRRGRPPKNAAPIEPVTYDEFEEGSTPAAGSPTAADSPSGMPRKRGRGRPSTSGLGRGRPRGGPSHSTIVPTDKQGNEQNVENYEVVLPEDPAGEQKVDRDGNLLGGRQYRCRTFTMMNRGNQLYMLSTEPARCAGFRDSYLFFQRHKQLYKIICNEEEKFDLIKREIIPHSYKGRAIGVVTARSVFREFGARMIVAGRRATDDYYEQAARDNGFTGEELADPNDPLPPPGQPYNQNQYVAWHGASSVYHNTAPALPEVKTSGAGGLFTVSNAKRKKLTAENWMHEYCNSAVQFNELLQEHRRRLSDGIYEPHTNLKFYPEHMQPTAYAIEKVSDGLPDADDFFDPAVPAEGRHYAANAAYVVEYETAAPPNTLGVSAGNLALAKSYKNGALPVGDYLDLDCPMGLSMIPPDIYETMSDEVKKAIQEQIEREQLWGARFGITNSSSN